MGNEDKAGEHDEVEMTNSTPKKYTAADFPPADFDDPKPSFVKSDFPPAGFEPEPERRPISLPEIRNQEIVAQVPLMEDDNRELNRVIDALRAAIRNNQALHISYELNYDYSWDDVKRPAVGRLSLGGQMQTVDLWATNRQLLKQILELQKH